MSQIFKSSAYFNPRSHERSDEIAPTVPPVGIYFNPRSHERSDKSGSPSTAIASISIHAPTRGATLMCDKDLKNGTFQSTLPREERHFQFAQPSLYKLNFNPRSHERSDGNQSEMLLKFRISIHAPTRGATMATYSVSLLMPFQSTLPREERRLTRHLLAAGYIDFNPRSHERSDLCRSNL